MTKAMTLRMPDVLHEALRAQAYKERTSITALVLDSLEQNVEKPGTLCDQRWCWEEPVVVTAAGFHFCVSHTPRNLEIGGER